MAVAASFTAPLIVRADTLSENFATDPAPKGWHVFGDADLFSWDNAAGNLAMTWDSSASNSFYFHALGTVLARDDDFSLAFDLQLQDITTPTKAGPFEIAVGLINLQSATRSDYWRGSGVDPVHGPRSVFEFDYFTSGYYTNFGDVLPSISPTIVSSNNAFASGFDLVELTNGVTYHIEMVYRASNATMRTTVTTDGVAIASFGDVVLGAGFDDFRLDTLAICSYSDAGDDYDSVLAHGTIDNMVVTMPPRPIGVLSGQISGGQYVLQFESRTNWVYEVQRSSDLQSWVAIGAPFPGSGAQATVYDPLAGSAAFYRVNASRP